MEVNIYSIGWWTLRLKCTQYGASEQGGLQERKGDVCVKVRWGGECSSFGLKKN